MVCEFDEDKLRELLNDAVYEIHQVIFHQMRQEGDREWTVQTDLLEALKLMGKPYDTSSWLIAS